MKNRLANVKNEFQTDRKRVLCVCSAGLLRSPTAAWILSNDPFDFNTRAVGISIEYALIPIDDAHIYWADEIVCMDEQQKNYIKNSNFLENKPVHVLNVPDNFSYKEQPLVRILFDKLEKIYL